MQLLHVLKTGPSAFRLVGELDMSNMKDVETALEDDVATGSDMTLELSELSFIDSSGIHVLIRTARQLLGHGRLILAYPSQAVRRILEMTQLDKLANLEIVDGTPRGGH